MTIIQSVREPLSQRERQQLTHPDRHNLYEYTGYETDLGSGLEYAGARFYDPDLGLFLTSDPAQQFASPYTYTNWDPVNRTDPNGAAVDLVVIGIVAAIAFAVGFASAAIQAGVNGASLGQALKAGAISGAISGASAAGLGLIGYGIGAAAGEAAANVLPVFNAVVAAGGVYGAVESARSGQWAAFSISVLMFAYGLYSAETSNSEGAVGEGGATSDEVRSSWAQAELEPAGSGALTDDQIGNIVFNETRSLSGDGIDAARADLAGTIMNADAAWGSQRSMFAGTAPSSLPNGISSGEQQTLSSIRSTVGAVRSSRALGFDSTHGATNFNLRPYPSPKAPPWARALQLQGIHGGFANSFGPPQYIHIWQNPYAGSGRAI